MFIKRTTTNYTARPNGGDSDEETVVGRELYFIQIHVPEIQFKNITRQKRARPDTMCLSKQQVRVQFNTLLKESFFFFPWVQSQKRIRLSDQMFFLGIINSEEVSYE